MKKYAFRLAVLLALIFGISVGVTAQNDDGGVLPAIEVKEVASVWSDAIGGFVHVWEEQGVPIVNVPDAGVGLVGSIPVDTTTLRHGADDLPGGDAYFISGSTKVCVDAEWGPTIAMISVEAPGAEAFAARIKLAVESTGFEPIAMSECVP